MAESKALVKRGKTLTQNEVTDAAEMLFELANRMKAPAFSFKESDISHIDVIASTLEDLSMMRARAEEAYETETIKASALRHKFDHFPREINTEIEKLVRAARGQNQDTIDQLSKDLQSVHSQIASLQLEIEHLNQENAFKSADLVIKREEHEVLVTALNKRLANKATQQIDLNEELNSVKECNQLIVLMEEDIVQVKEDIAQEKQETKEKRVKLMKETVENHAQFTVQKSENDTLQKQVKVTQHQLTEEKLKIEELTKTLRNHEKIIEHNREEKHRLETELAAQTAAAEVLTNKKHQLHKSIEEMDESFAAWCKEMQAKIVKINERIQREEQVHEELIEKREKCETDLHEAEARRELDAARVKEMQDLLQIARKELSEKAGDIGRMMEEIDFMEQRVVSLNETHVESEPVSVEPPAITVTPFVSVESPELLTRSPISSITEDTEEDLNESQNSTTFLFNKQISELRDQVARERDERMIVQNERDVLQKEIDEFKASNAKFMREMNKRITDGKYMHTQLNNEHMQLTRGIQEDEQTAVTLQQQNEQTKVDTVHMQETLKQTIVNMQEDIVRMQEAIVRLRQDIVDFQPSFDEMERYFNKNMDKYEAMKKTLIALKNKKMGLEDTEKKTKLDIERQKIPLEQLEIQLTMKREERNAQCKRIEEERLKIESNIYAVGCKRRTVILENARFTEKIEDYEKAIKELRHEWERVQKEKSFCRKSIATQKGHMKECWTEDGQIMDTFVEKDRLLIGRLDQLLEETQAREDLISQTALAMEKELNKLYKFLNIAAGTARVKQSKENKDSLLPIEEADENI